MIDLNKIEINELIKIAKEFDLDLLVLFGSRAKGSSKKNSDYDFAFLKFNLDIDEEISFFDKIEDLFVNEKIDLINLENNYNVVLKQEIFNNGICFYEKNKGFFEKEKEKIYFDYIDSFALLDPNKKKYLAKEI